jgi:hypothetical protein
MSSEKDAQRHRCGRNEKVPPFNSEATCVSVKDWEALNFSHSEINPCFHLPGTLFQSEFPAKNSNSLQLYPKLGAPAPY